MYSKETVTALFQLFFHIVQFAVKIFLRPIVHDNVHHSVTTFKINCIPERHSVYIFIEIELIERIHITYAITCLVKVAAEF